MRPFTSPPQLSPLQILYPIPQTNEETLDFSQQTSINLPINLPQYPVFPEEDYKFLEPLGQGDRTQVFKAYNKRTGSFLAIKKLHIRNSPNPHFFEKSLQTEIEILEKISASPPEISRKFLAFYGVFQDKNHIYLLMELGVVSLEELIAAKRSFSAAETSFILYKLVNSLLDLKQRKIVNRDIKPSNIILIPSEKPYIYDFKLTDFGVGHILQENEVFLNKSTLLGFTPAYTAPEIASNLVNSQTNRNEVYEPFLAEVFSLGLVALKLLNVNFDEKMQGFLAERGILGNILLNMLNSRPESRISLENLAKVLQEIVENMRILPPKIERGYLEKAIKLRISKRNQGDYQQIITELLENFEKYESIGRLQELAGALHLCTNEILKPGSLLGSSPEEIKNLLNFAKVYEKRGDLYWVKSCLQKAIEFARKNVRDPKGILVETSYEAACIYSKIGEFALAESLLNECLRKNKEVHGEKHLFFGKLLRELARVYFFQRDLKKSLMFLQMAIEILHNLLYSEEKESNHQILLKHVSYLSSNENYYITFLSIIENVANSDRNFPQSLVNINELETRFFELSEQEKIFLKAYKSRENSWKKLVGIINGELAKCLTELGKLYVFLGNLDKAQGILYKSWITQERLHGEVCEEVAKIFCGLARGFSRKFMHEKAEKFALRALEIRKKLVFGEQNLEICESFIVLEEVCENKGDFRGKEEFCKKARETLLKIYKGDEEKIKEMTGLLKN